MDDNSIAIPLFGESDKNIKYIEKSLNLKINARGNILIIEGKQASRAKHILSSLIEVIREKKIIDNDEVENAIRLSSLNNSEIMKVVIKTPKKKIVARSLAQANFIKALKENNLYHKIWQAYAALLPVKTVGVMGDNRTYEYLCLLRAITSEDGMTADFFEFKKSFLQMISNKIVNSIRGINRVVYDVTSKPPSTIELE